MQRFRERPVEAMVTRTARSLNSCLLIDLRRLCCAPPLVYSSMAADTLEPIRRRRGASCILVHFLAFCSSSACTSLTSRHESRESFSGPPMILDNVAAYSPGHFPCPPVLEQPFIPISPIPRSQDPRLGFLFGPLGCIDDTSAGGGQSNQLDVLAVSPALASVCRTALKTRVPTGGISKKYS